MDFSKTQGKITVSSNKPLVLQTKENEKEAKQEMKTFFKKEKEMRKENFKQEEEGIDRQVQVLEKEISIRRERNDKKQQREKSFRKGVQQVSDTPDIVILVEKIKELKSTKKRSMKKRDKEIQKIDRREKEIMKLMEKQLFDKKK